MTSRRTHGRATGHTRRGAPRRFKLTRCLLLTALRSALACESLEVSQTSPATVQAGQGGHGSRCPTQRSSGAVQAGGRLDSARHPDAMAAAGTRTHPRLAVQARRSRRWDTPSLLAHTRACTPHTQPDDGGVPAWCIVTCVNRYARRRDQHYSGSCSVRIRCARPADLQALERRDARAPALPPLLRRRRRRAGRRELVRLVRPTATQLVFPAKCDATPWRPSR